MKTKVATKRPWRETYEIERAKRIELIRGGQGRSTESVRRDGAGIVWCLVLVAGLLVILICAACGAEVTR